MSAKSLWTKNFTIITIGTFISAIGGVAMGIALSLVVFDQTASTWLSALYAAASLVPGMTLPFLLAPLIDRCNKKNLIVVLDYSTGVLYLLFLCYLRTVGFQYGAYVLFSFLTGCIGAVYNLAYECLYPELIPEGFTGKGYAVSSMIYPLTTTLITPLAAVIYQHWGVEYIFLGEGLLLLIAATFEVRITYKNHVAPQEEHRTLSCRLRAYLRELLEGIRYLRQEVGVRNIYFYMTVTNACGSANGLMTLAYFQTAHGLTTAMYSLLISAETIGRAVGAAVHYFIRIPEQKRYWLTVRVYLIYETCDGAMLFLAYPVMLVLKFTLGFLGVNTATLREAAVQHYLPDEIRARVKGLFSVLISIGYLLAELAVGALGEIFPYRAIVLGMACVSMFCIFLFIIRNRAQVKEVYNLSYGDPAQT